MNGVSLVLNQFSQFDTPQGKADAKNPKPMAVTVAAQLAAEHLVGSRGPLAGGKFESNGSCDSMNMLGHGKLETLLEVAKSKQGTRWERLTCFFRELDHYARDKNYVASIVVGRVPQRVLKTEELDPSIAVQNLVKKVQGMAVGQGTCLPIVLAGSPNGHAIVISIERDVDRTLRLRVFNEGGNAGFHEEKKDKQGRKKVLVVVEHRSIEESKFTKDFFSKLLHLHAYTAETIKQRLTTLYKKLIPSLKGKKGDVSGDKRCWSHAQIGGSCTTKSIWAVARSVLNDREWIDFKEEVKLRSLLGVYRHIKTKGDTSQQTRVVAQEIVKKLTHHYKKHLSQPLPKEIVKVKKELKAQKVASQKKSLSQKILDFFKRVIQKIVLFFYKLKARFALLRYSRMHATFFEDAVVPFSKLEHKKLQSYLERIRQKREVDKTNLEELDARLSNYEKFFDSCSRVTDRRLHAVHLRTILKTEMFEDIFNRINLLNNSGTDKQKAYIKKLVPRVKALYIHFFESLYMYKRIHAEVYYPNDPSLTAIHRVAEGHIGKK